MSPFRQSGAGQSGAEADAAPRLTVLSWPYRRRGVTNPYTRRLGEALSDQGLCVREFSAWALLTGRVDVWHMHWPEGTLRSPSRLLGLLRLTQFMLLVAVARLRNVACVWTMHNLESHERAHRDLERRLWRFLIPRLDGIMLLSRASRDLLLERHPAAREVPCHVIPHGHYRGSYPDTETRLSARATYGWTSGERIVAFVGRVRAYKNVDALITAFRAMPDPDLRLVVAGDADDPDVGRRLRQAAADDARVRLDLGFVPDDAIQRPLRAADLAVLPYRDVLNSGSAILALSFDCPVLVPERGAMGELRERVGAPWVQCYTGALTPETLRDALDQAARRPEGAPDLSAFEWSAIGRQLASFYRAIHRRNDAARRESRARPIEPNHEL
ncbi:glycosyltransferase family 4 protein [Azospirillum canadense]|uniref:glycosyltransferase family 4 protein n=1 Tax=Azospirillum canadense TaxID=403962 RepID=UPI002227A4D4|nr:glycosyltransferase [Azospirillum canadense]MCW2238568.1 glycosyltransferase involved in cell wall biosynthesis [Azospirillum canadense]